MNSTNIFLIARQTRIQVLQQKAMWVLMFLLAAIIGYAGITGLLQYKKAEATRIGYQQIVRKNWENNPDKHPHRMAHYGSIAFRPKSALSVFDYGLESYTGNAVFLEAHKQNTTNFSEASLSSTMLRFGEISIAMVLQLLLPLFIFFIGFNCISQDRENGTLKILISQGLHPLHLLAGRILGIATVAAIVLIPAFLFTAVLQLFAASNSAVWLQLIIAFLIYTAGVLLYSGIAVLVSAWSNTSKLSLVLLMGIWLLMMIVLPRGTQTLANTIYSTPSKIAFENGIDGDIIKEGDSHNPDDQHYKGLKDSVLKANHAESVEQLDFNYSGFQMAEAEKMSAQIYDRHLQRLIQIYQRQNRLQVYAAFINPYLGIKQLSMAFSQTDFNTYTQFQQQTEAYRYALAQAMNELQIKLIPNKKLAATDKNYSIDKKYWACFHDFQYKAPSFQLILQQELLAICSLVYWLLLVVALVLFTSKKINVI